MSSVLWPIHTGIYYSAFRSLIRWWYVQDSLYFCQIFIKCNKFAHFQRPSEFIKDEKNTFKNHLFLKKWFSFTQSFFLSAWKNVFLIHGEGVNTDDQNLDLKHQNGVGVYILIIKSSQIVNQMVRIEIDPPYFTWRTENRHLM